MKSKELISHSNISTVFARHIPQKAISYCLELWLAYPFHFKVTRQRKTKQGDYRYHKLQNTHVITVNRNLNPYAFLITYMHEVAHLDAFQQHGHAIAPHGKEWKKCFQRLMKPLLLPDVFPEKIPKALATYMRNPKASTRSDPELIMALQAYDVQEGLISLSKVQINRIFRFNHRFFLKEQVKRTRAWCKEVKTGKRYTIAQSALVEIVQNEADNRRVISELTSSKN